jgi:MFS family permease
VANQFSLLKERRFLPFFLTQSLGAFNDNVFKQSLVVLISFKSASFAPADRILFTNLAAALFILPFFLFSATAGQLADKFDKSKIARWVKVFEIAVMAIAAYGFLQHDAHEMTSIWILMGCLFLMGLHSTVFGPVKYAILPQVLREEELTGGNGLVEMATNMAILLGTLLGTWLVAIDQVGPMAASICVLVIALVGLLASRQMPPLPAQDSTLTINHNVLSETWRSVQYLRTNRTLFLSCLGISWFWFFGAMYITQLPIYAKDVLRSGTPTYTAILTLFSIGTGIGALLCERLSHHRVELGLVPFGAIGMTIFGVDLYFAHPQIASVATETLGAWLASPGSIRICIDVTLMALFSGLFIVPLFALVQSRSDPARRSRVIAANNILNALFMVAAAILSIILLAKMHWSIPQS